MHGNFCNNVLLKQLLNNTYNTIIQLLYCFIVIIYALQIDMYTHVSVSRKKYFYFRFLHCRTIELSEELY